MDNLTFEYKNRHYFIDVYQDKVLMEAVFRLFDITELKKEKIDFSNKELAKIEIRDYLKHGIQKDMKKCIVATVTRPLSMVAKFKMDDLLKIRDELLKGIK